MGRKRRYIETKLFYFTGFKLNYSEIDCDKVHIVIPKAPLENYFK